MEILILGLLLVALMVYASTRIKKTAARAFEEELVDTDDFTIVKPEGFIHPLNTDSVFEANSKDFGTDEAADLRLARANLIVTAGGSYDAISREVAASGSELLGNESFVVDGRHERVIEVEALEKGYPVNIFSKIIDGDGKVYRLEVVVLREEKDNFLPRIEKMLDSFALK
jgi:hypothetical protein